MLGEEAEAWDWVTCQLQRDKHSRDRIRCDQNAILRHLRIGDALHAAQNRVNENGCGCDVETCCAVHFEEAGEGHASASHLTDNIGHGHNDQRDNGHNACSLAVETVAYEFRNRILAELAQIGRKKHRHKHVTTRPAHEEGRVVIAYECDQTCHRDEGGRRHPVSCSCHAVQDRRNTTPCCVEFRCGARAGPNRDTEVERKRQPHNDNIECCLIHNLARPLLFVHAIFFV